MGALSLESLNLVCGGHLNMCCWEAALHWEGEDWPQYLAVSDVVMKCFLEWFRGFSSIKPLGFCWYNAWGENIYDELSLSSLWANILLENMSCKIFTCNCLCWEGVTQGQYWQIIHQTSYCKWQCVFWARNKCKGWLLLLYSNLPLVHYFCPLALRKPWIPLVQERKY